MTSTAPCLAATMSSPPWSSVSKTHGELANWPPHLHALASAGAFAPDGTFISMPEIPVKPYLKVWEKRLFDLLLAAGRITPQAIEQMRTWQHSGFSVDKSVHLAAFAPTNPAAKAITLGTTITPLSGAWARLESFSGRGYGQTVGW